MLTLFVQTTHLVTNQEDVTASSVKVRNAQKFGVFIVTEAFIFDSVAQGYRKDESSYYIGAVQVCIYFIASIAILIVE